MSEHAAVRLLLVEDEEALGKLLARFLERAGFTVVAVTHGVQAIVELQRSDAEFAAMILDLTLPDMAGEAVLAAARGLRPGLPVILTSGMAAPVRSSDSAPGPTEFLMKPYLPARLGEAVRRLLEPQSPSSSTAS